MTELARALIARRNGDDTDPLEWADAISEAQMRFDIVKLRALVEAALTK